MKAENSNITKRHLYPGIRELIRLCGIRRAPGNRELTSELGKQWREAIKEDLKERRAAAMVEAANAGKSVRNAHRSFPSQDQDYSTPTPRSNS
ncbi:unnamed protein product [Angiostrongylus costaricensis]|uniref:HMG box domain-containing protein n=1 Tax=Angiostrongylus costaricensis TaxID=334426 RepID=A0A0R3PHY9_ANGCS|nr:unnamed protein product [Angiostrongylus costaricensis]